MRYTDWTKTMNNKINEPTAGEKIRWQTIVAKYAKPDLRRSLWQVANTLIPYFVLWYLMIRSVEVSYCPAVPDTSSRAGPDMTSAEMGVATTSTAPAPTTISIRATVCRRNTATTTTWSTTGAAIT